MQLKVRKDKNGDWGFVESFQSYSYNFKGTVSVTLAITPEGKLSMPYVYRGEEFIPLSTIKEEMGIEKYLKAKKPFYSKLSDGFVASIKAGIDYNTGEFLEEKTSFSIFKLSKSDVFINSGTLECIRVVELPNQVINLMGQVARDVSSCRGDRLVFLESRVQGE